MEIHKVNRVNVFIEHNKNKHLPHLNNHILDLMKIERFGGEFKPNSIKLSAMPEYLMEKLKKLNVNFSYK